MACGAFYTATETVARPGRARLGIIRLPKHRLLNHKRT